MFSGFGSIGVKVILQSTFEAPDYIASSIEILCLGKHDTFT